tara:strand:+ start:356 stop:592 length:237 start_codon:yes stop_codon:yes gene_type:complete
VLEYCAQKTHANTDATGKILNTKNQKCRRRFVVVALNDDDALPPPRNDERGSSMRGLKCEEGFATQRLLFERESAWKK